MVSCAADKVRHMFHGRGFFGRDSDSPGYPATFTFELHVLLLDQKDKLLLLHSICVCSYLIFVGEGVITHPVSSPCRLHIILRS